MSDIDKGVITKTMVDRQTDRQTDRQAGYPSVDKPWIKYYPEGALDFDFPRMKAYDLIYERNKNRKDSIALEYEGHEISYGELFDQIEQRTEFFIQKGVKENDIVTISMLMSPEFVYDWYALGRINAISNLIDPRTSPEGIRHYLEEAESRYLLNTDLFTGKIKKAIETQQDYHVINYSLLTSSVKMPFAFGMINRITGAYSKAIAKHDKRFETAEKTEAPKQSIEDRLPEYKHDQPLTIVHTGGTTGMPKGVILSHDNYNAMAYEYMKSEIGFAANDRFLLIMPPWISYGSGMLHMSMITGMKATIISKLDSKKIADYVLQYKPQWFAGVPAHYKRIAACEKISKRKVPFLKAGAVGGDAMSAELYRKVNDYLINNGAKQGVYPGYALTEVTSAFAVKQLGEYKAGSVGIPLPGCTVGVFRFDEETKTTIDEELSYGETGEICLRTPNQMLGYFKDEKQTNGVLKRHKDGYTWVHTGDLGHVDKDGFIFVDGRIKEMITRYDGFKIYPSLIENLLNKQDLVAQCKVVGVSDRKHGHGQIPMAVIVLKKGKKNTVSGTLKELESLCRKELPEYYMEGCKFKEIDKLPLTAIGKVDYRKLIFDEENK